MPHHSCSTTHNMMVGGHRLTDLVRRVLENASRRGSNLNPIQRAALDRYRRDSIYSTHPAGRHFEDEVIRAYFTLFDDLFFGGSLTGPCRLEFGGEDSDRNGHTICEEHYGRGSATGVIIIFSQGGAIPHGRERMLKYLGVLLHEMAHAFLELYSGESDDLIAHIGAIGRSGHGFAWQDVAFSLARNVADSRLLNLPLKLNRLASLGRELRASEALVPRDLGRWGFAQDDMTLEDGIYYAYKTERW